MYYVIIHIIVKIKIIFILLIKQVVKINVEKSNESVGVLKLKRSLFWEGVVLQPNACRPTSSRLGLTKQGIFWSLSQDLQHSFTQKSTQIWASFIPLWFHFCEAYAEGMKICLPQHC
jgi:hypothetical protein